jgi:imidazolonepropionase
VKLHAEQLSNLHGAALAAEFGALSADHLEYTRRRRASRRWPKRARSRCCCPAPSISSARPRRRRSTLLRAHGVPIALATDCNPGTSPLTSLLLAMNMAATLFRLTVDECLPASRARPRGRSGLADEIGTLEAGKRCDLAIWDIERPAELVYRMGFNPLHARVWRGQ